MEGNGEGTEARERRERVIEKALVVEIFERFGRLGSGGRQCVLARLFASSQSMLDSEDHEFVTEIEAAGVLVRLMEGLSKEGTARVLEAAIGQLGLRVVS